MAIPGMWNDQDHQPSFIQVETDSRDNIPGIDPHIKLIAAYVNCFMETFILYEIFKPFSLYDYEIEIIIIRMFFWIYFSPFPGIFSVSGLLYH